MWNVDLSEEYWEAPQDRGIHFPTWGEVSKVKAWNPYHKEADPKGFAAVLDSGIGGSLDAAQVGGGSHIYPRCSLNVEAGGGKYHKPDREERGNL